MASKLAILKEEETKLLKIKEKLQDQLRRLQVEELALRSMLQVNDQENRVNGKEENAEKTNDKSTMDNRRNKMWLRYKDDISPRTIPKPNLPPTSNAKLSANYYYQRDERRKASPPFIIASSFSTTTPKLEAGASSTDQAEVTSTTPEAKAKFPTPGFPTKWTLSTDEPYLRT